MSSRYKEAVFCQVHLCCFFFIDRWILLYGCTDTCHSAALPLADCVSHIPEACEAAHNSGGSATARTGPAHTKKNACVSTGVTIYVFG